MATHIFQGTRLGLTIADIKRAMANGGDISLIAAILARALNNPPIDIAGSLEAPLSLPEAEVLFFGEKDRLGNLMETWHEGAGYSWNSPVSTELILLPLPPHGKNTAAYLELMIGEVKPDILALDAGEGELSATLRYAFSLPAAFGMTVYADVRLEEGKRYGNFIFYPGSLTETAVIRAWLDKIPLLPVGKPYSPGDEELQQSDEDIEDEDSSGLYVKAAYRELDGFLETKPPLPSVQEYAATAGETLVSSVSISLYMKLTEESKSTASRLLDLAFLLNNPDRKTKILTVLDLKHYPAVSRNLTTMLAGGYAAGYIDSTNVRPGKMKMLGQHSTAGVPGEDTAEKTVTQRLFEQEFETWAEAKAKEVLDAASVDRSIALIMERVRTHPFVLKGASVRGSLGLKEIVSGLSEMDSGITREKIEKAALIALPARLRLKPGVKVSCLEVVGESAKEALYGIEFYRTAYRAAAVDSWLSPEEINRLLTNLSQGKKPQTEKKTGVDEEKRMKSLEANKLLRRSIEGFVLTPRSIERLLQELEERWRTGKISREEYEIEKARLTGLLETAQKNEYDLSAKEIAGLVIDLMEIVDKKYENSWGNDINFFRVSTYYRLKLEGGQKLESWQQSFIDLKYGLDLLERRGILKTSPAGERVLGGQGLSALLGYARARNQGLMILQSGITRNRTLQSTRSEEISPFTAVNSFRDISVRHTIKEVARQHKELGNVRKSDFRVYNRPRKWLATDIVICLDTSGSIAEHRKLIYERLAAAAITEAARYNGDRTAVVAFESASNTPIALSDESNEQVNDYLATLSVKGGTNIAEGLKCAVDLLTRGVNHNKKHIFLITDGEPNVISEKAMKTLQRKKEMPQDRNEKVVLKETPRDPDDEEELKEISRFGRIRSTGTPQDPDEEQVLKEIPRDPNEEAVLVETRRAAAKGIYVSVVLLAADQMKGYNFAKSVARAGNGSVIVLDCGDETPIIPELVGKK